TWLRIGHRRSQKACRRFAAPKATVENKWGGKHARADAEPPTPYIGPRRLRLDLAWDPGDRIPRPGRSGPSLKLRRSRGARETGRERSRRAGRRSRRSRPDARLE